MIAQRTRGIAPASAPAVESTTRARLDHSGFMPASNQTLTAPITSISAVRPTAWRISAWPATQAVTPPPAPATGTLMASSTQRMQVGPSKGFGSVGMPPQTTSIGKASRVPTPMTQVGRPATTPGEALGGHRGHHVRARRRAGRAAVQMAMLSDSMCRARQDADR